MEGMRPGGWRRLLLCIAGCAVAVVSVPVTMRMSVSRHMYADLVAVPAAQTIVIPGASVVRGAPSSILQERIDAALALYREGRARRIIVTGDGGRDYDEVEAMLNALISVGVARDDIFPDRLGLDTYSSMYRARHVFGARSVVVVTQDFHLPRAIFIARALGIEAYGFAAEGGRMRDYAREIPASIKAVADVLAGRTPDILGAPIPLAGPGNASR